MRKRVFLKSQMRENHMTGSVEDTRQPASYPTVALLLEEVMSYLYRGVSDSIHRKNNGRLVPKKSESFRYIFHCGEGLACGSGAKCGSSETNAVIRHQLNQEGFPTSGVSTTPFFERAKLYATHNAKRAGYVYKIDRSLLATYNVQEFIVSECANQPSVPEDDEVILVASDFGPLPEEIVVDVIPVEDKIPQR